MEFIFDTNDDMYLRMIASGEMTGVPEANLFFIGYPVGLFLKFMYGIFPAVPWYGLFLFLLSLMAVAVIFIAIFPFLKNRTEKIAGTLFYLVFLGAFFGTHLLRISFTAVTAFVETAALIWFYTRKEDVTVKQYLKSNIPSMLLSMLALCLRLKAALMIVLVFGCLGIARLLNNRKAAKNILSLGTCMLALGILCMCAIGIPFRSDEWKEYYLYNQERSLIYDYTWYPSYEENRSFYEDMDISEEALIAAQHYMLVNNEEINPDTIPAIAEKMNSRTFSGKDILRIVREFITYNLFDYQDRPLNILVYSMYLLFLILSVLERNRKALTDMGMLFAGRMALWIYLLYVGRAAYRVTQGIYFAEFAVLLAICIRYRLWHFPAKKGIVRAATGIFIVWYVFLAIQYGIPREIRIERSNKNNLVYSEAFSQIKEYFSEHEDAFYLCDMKSFTWFMESVFAKNETYVGNYLFLGSWLANSPWYEKKLEQYGLEKINRETLTGGKVYFVFQDTEETGWEYLEKYYGSKYSDLEIVVTDTFKANNGLQFFILQLREKD